MIFAREASDSLTSLVKKIDAATLKNKDKRMGSFIVFLTDEENAKEKLTALAKKEGITHTFFAIDNVPGPPDYHIAKDADVTVVLYNKRTIEANYAFKKGELNAAKIEQILADLPKILPESKEKAK